MVAARRTLERSLQVCYRKSSVVATLPTVRMGIKWTILMELRQGVYSAAYRMPSITRKTALDAKRRSVPASCREYRGLSQPPYRPRERGSRGHRQTRVHRRHRGGPVGGGVGGGHVGGGLSGSGGGRSRHLRTGRYVAVYRRVCGRGSRACQATHPGPGHWCRRGSRPMLRTVACGAVHRRGDLRARDAPQWAA